jgi:tRNA(adenine34) deaminase
MAGEAMTEVIPGADESFMRRCIDLAREARERGDAPVGALIVRDGLVIAEAGERVDSVLDIAGHAEIVAIQTACRLLGTLNLSGCMLYSNAEPCVMCAYAIRQTGISRVVFGATVPDMGGATSRYPILTAPDVSEWPEPPAVVAGVLVDECAALVSGR